VQLKPAGTLNSRICEIAEDGGKKTFIMGNDRWMQELNGGRWMRDEEEGRTGKRMDEE
jgi:hypothetical protein